MILGNIDNLAIVPYLPTVLVNAITFVKKNIDSNSKNGVYEIDGNKMFAIVAENKPRTLEHADPEYHRRYIDIQIVLSGAETFGVSVKSQSHNMIEDRLDNDDIAFVSTPSDECYITLSAGDFAIFYPNELHKPLGFVSSEVSVIKKVVVKVDADLITKG